MGFSPWFLGCFAESQKTNDFSGLFCNFSGAYVGVTLRTDASDSSTHSASSGSFIPRPATPRRARRVPSARYMPRSYAVSARENLSIESGGRRIVTARVLASISSTDSNGRSLTVDEQSFFPIRQASEPSRIILKLHPWLTSNRLSGAKLGFTGDIASPSSSDSVILVET